MDIEKFLYRPFSNLPPRNLDAELFNELLARDPQGLERELLEPTELLHSKIQCKAVHLSDTHFGAPYCCGQDISQFLDHIDSKRLLLGGDLVEFWRGKFNLFNLYERDPAQAACLLKIANHARQNEGDVITPGNHDGSFSTQTQDFGAQNLKILPEAVYETTDGKRILILHGDRFDGFLFRSPWLGGLGSVACEAIGDFSLKIEEWRKNPTINGAFKTFGLRKQWSLAKALQNAYQKTSYKFIFERAALRYLFAKNADIFARNKIRASLSLNLEKFLDGITCGHTHIPFQKTVLSPRDKDGNLLGPEVVTYSNTGGWTEPSSLRQGWKYRYQHYPPFNTAIIEHFDGQREHVQWIPDVGIVRLHLRSDGSFRGALTKKEARRALVT